VNENFVRNINMVAIRATVGTTTQGEWFKWGEIQDSTMH
jgi:hypothetical protein